MVMASTGPPYRFKESRFFSGGRLEISLKSASFGDELAEEKKKKKKKKKKKSNDELIFRYFTITRPDRLLFFMFC